MGCITVSGNALVYNGVSYAPGSSDPTSCKWCEGSGETTTSPEMSEKTNFRLKIVPLSDIYTLGRSLYQWLFLVR